MTNTTIQYIATALFGIAVLHTFCAFYFERLAHKSANHSGLFHLLGEVEALPLQLTMQSHVITQSHYLYL
jgi:hypothetical protein